MKYTASFYRLNERGMGINELTDMETGEHSRISTPWRERGDTKEGKESWKVAKDALLYKTNGFGKTQDIKQ